MPRPSSTLIEKMRRLSRSNSLAWLFPQESTRLMIMTQLWHLFLHHTLVNEQIRLYGLWPHYSFQVMYLNNAIVCIILYPYKITHWLHLRDWGQTLRSELRSREGCQKAHNAHNDNQVHVLVISANKGTVLCMFKSIIWRSCAALLAGLEHRCYSFASTSKN